MMTDCKHPSPTQAWEFFWDVRIGFWVMCLLGTINAGYAQGTNVSGRWRVVGETGRLTTCSVEYDRISVDEIASTIRDFARTHSNPFDKGSEQWSLQQILKAVQSENDASVQKFVQVNSYDGCNYQLNTYVQKADGSLENLPEYNRVTQMACGHQFDRRRSLLDGAPEHTQAEDPSLSARHACGDKNALSGGLKRIDLRGEYLFVTLGDGLVQKFERIGQNK